MDVLAQDLRLGAANADRIDPRLIEPQVVATFLLPNLRTLGEVFRVKRFNWAIYASGEENAQEG